MIYADFESIFVLEILGCSFAYKLVCIDDQFSKPVKSYLGQDTFHKFLTSMV